MSELFSAGLHSRCLCPTFCSFIYPRRAPESAHMAPVSLLTPVQRQDLHRAIVEYLTVQDVGKDVVQSLIQSLGVDGNDAAPSRDEGILERKWAAVVRLQRKILDLESNNEALAKEVKELRTNGPPAPAGSTRSIDNWLPRAPPQYTLVGHRSRVTSVAFHPTWTMLVSGSEDGSFKVWDYEQGEIEKTVMAHTRAVHSVAFAPSGLLVTASADLSVKVWDPANGMANIQTLLGHDHTVSAVCVAVDPASRTEYAISASRDKTIRVWQLDTGFCVRVIHGHTDWVRALDVTNLVSADKQMLLSVSSDRTARLTPLFGEAGDGSVYDGGHRHVIESCAIAPPSSIAFLAKHAELQPNDIVFATGARDSTICVWSSTSDKPLFKLVGHDNWVQGVAFHPSGRFLVSVSDDKTMRIWDLVGAKLIKTISAHDHFVTSLSWHGKRIATGSIDQTVKLWN